MDRFCAGSAFFCGSGILSFYQFLEEMDPDPDPYIWIQLDPDLDPQKKKYGSATLFLTHKYITFLKGHEFKLVGN